MFKFTKNTKDESRKDIYIEAIEYGKRQLSSKTMTRVKDLRDYLEEKGYDVSESIFISNLFLDIFGSQNMRNNHYSTDPGYLNADVYFKLLDYEELQHARKSSQEAKVIAIWAICISGVLALASVILNIYQLFFIK